MSPKLRLSPNSSKSPSKSPLKANIKGSSIKRESLKSMGKVSNKVDSR